MGLRQWVAGALFKTPVHQPLRQRFSIGVGTYADQEPEVLEWGEGAVLRIGNYCSLAAGIKIFLGGNHRVDWVSTFPFSDSWPSARGIPGHPATRGDVEIGHDVWIGHGAVILSGVKIGNGAVVGACAVVARDIPPYAIAVGNPVRTIRRRFSDAQIQALERIAWWDWPEDRIARFMPLILSGDVDAFVRAATSDIDLPRP
jgi:chloramphenicol O-acetyltransferase type B